MEPTQNQNQETPNPVQLPSETPMQLEVTKQPTSNPEVSSVSSIAPAAEPTTQFQSLNSEPQKPLESVQFENTPDFAMTSGAVTPKSTSQRNILIIAGALGVLIVVGVAFYILRARNTQPTTLETPPTEVVTETSPVPTGTTDNTPAAPTDVTQGVTPAVTQTSIQDYLAVITGVETKTLEVIKSTPINVNSTTQSTDQIRFASDTLFANYQSLTQATVPDVAKADHAKLVDGYKKLVDSYDVVLKSLKENNKITQQAKDQFTANYNSSVVIINQSLTNIKKLK